MLRLGESHERRQRDGTLQLRLRHDAPRFRHVGQFADDGPGNGRAAAEVETTFGTVNEPGTTTAVLTTTAPAIPAGFQVGDPPAFDEISTTADVAFPVTVCIGLERFRGDDGADALPPRRRPVGRCHDVVHLQPEPGVRQRQLAVAVCRCVRGEPAYTLSGPFAPVDPQPTVNTVNAGRTVPVKFSLGGAFGLDVVEDGFPTSFGGPVPEGRLTPSSRRRTAQA